MTVHFNHTIVWSSDKKQGAAFLTEMLGLPDAVPYGPFMVVETDNGASIDYHDVEPNAHIEPQHYAFLVGEDDFDASYGRIREKGLDHWADPMRSQPNTINHHDGGRGVYFEGPDRHFYEIITRPYGS